MLYVLVLSAPPTAVRRAPKPRNGALEPADRPSSVELLSCLRLASEFLDMITCAYCNWGSCTRGCSRRCAIALALLLPPQFRFRFCLRASFSLVGSQRLRLPHFQSQHSLHCRNTRASTASRCKGICKKSAYLALVDSAVCFAGSPDSSWRLRALHCAIPMHVSCKKSVYLRLGWLGRILKLVRQRLQNVELQPKQRFRWRAEGCLHRTHLSVQLRAHHYCWWEEGLSPYFMVKAPPNRLSKGVDLQLTVWKECTCTSLSTASIWFMTLELGNTRSLNFIDSFWAEIENFPTILQVE